MQKSESIKNMAEALVTFHVKVDKISKDAANPFFKSKYASLSNILDAINTPLNESGLSFVQFPTGDHGLTTILMHTSGEYLQAEYTMRPTKDDPQGLGSAITYQRRYALSSILGLNIDDDDDANAASRPVKDELPWLNKGTAQFTGAVKKLQAGETTIAKIKTVMKVSKEVEQLLLNSIQPVNS